jgi:hypothetical protein
MSARAPAANERKKSGSRADATIQPTQVLDPVISNISHDPATAWMNVPDAENTVAAHKDRKCGYLRGATADVMSAG